MALKKIEVTLTLDDDALIEGPRPRWFGDGSEVVVTGKIREICVVRDGEDEFSLTIREDGSLILTKYSGGLHEVHLPQNLHIRPTRPWKEK